MRSIASTEASSASRTSSGTETAATQVAVRIGRRLTSSPQRDMDSHIRRRNSSAWRRDATSGEVGANHLYGPGSRNCCGSFACSPSRYGAGQGLSGFQTSVRRDRPSSAHRAAGVPNNVDGLDANHNDVHARISAIRQATPPQPMVISLRQVSMPGSWSRWGLAVWGWREAWHGGHDGSRTGHPNKTEVGEAFGEAFKCRSSATTLSGAIWISATVSEDVPNALR